MTLPYQLEDIHLLRCSLLPGELLTFLDDIETWSNLLESYPDITEIPNFVSNARFQIQLHNARVWFEVELPRLLYGTMSVVHAKGNIDRDQQERWQATVEQKLEEIKDSEYPIYELFSVHLLPLLHAEFDNVSSSTKEGISPGQSSFPSPAIPVQYHALLTSHHLVSPQKRRSLQQWSSEQNILGFAKVGYPGIIYAEGLQNNIEEFVVNVKAMQWLALKVRFIEPVDGPGQGVLENRWVEFQKVGEVVEEMRRIGRGEFILEMGIGSAGSK